MGNNQGKEEEGRVQALKLKRRELSLKATREPWEALEQPLGRVTMVLRGVLPKGGHYRVLLRMALSRSLSFALFLSDNSSHLFCFKGPRLALNSWSSCLCLLCPTHLSFIRRFMQVSGMSRCGRGLLSAIREGHTLSWVPGSSEPCLNMLSLLLDICDTSSQTLSGWRTATEI